MHRQTADPLTTIQPASPQFTLRQILTSAHISPANSVKDDNVKLE